MVTSEIIEVTCPYCHETQISPRVIQNKYLKIGWFDHEAKSAYAQGCVGIALMAVGKSKLPESVEFFNRLSALKDDGRKAFYIVIPDVESSYIRFETNFEIPSNIPQLNLPASVKLETRKD